MRYVPSALRARLLSAQQTLYNNADPRAVLWISRPGTVLHTAQFLERQTVLTGTAVTSVSLAARRPIRGRAADRLYLAWVDGGTARLRYATAKTVMSDHLWLDAGWSADATAVAVAFDGTMPKADGGKVEFVTSGQPWVFWVDGGALYAEQLGGELYTLATENCSAVSAVRAMWSEVGGFDFGLVCFFLLGGSLYYRQLIGGAWTDASAVSFGPPGVTYTQVAAFRTWDYRVGVQLKGSDGNVYELFTQFMGVGKQNVEHIAITGITATGTLTEIHYTDAQTAEHISIAGITAEGGLWSTAVPAIVSAANEDDAGDWGKRASFVFDVHLTASEVAAQPGAFSIVDAYGTSYIAATAELLPDGKTVALTFTDFNNASGVCAATYTAGTVTSRAGTALETVTCAFTPQNLVPSAIPVPEVVEVTNV